MLRDTWVMKTHGYTDTAPNLMFWCLNLPSLFLPPLPSFYEVTNNGLNILSSQKVRCRCTLAGVKEHRSRYKNKLNAVSILIYIPLCLRRSSSVLRGGAAIELTDSKISQGCVCVSAERMIAVIFTIVANSVGFFCVFFFFLPHFRFGPSEFSCGKVFAVSHNAQWTWPTPSQSARARYRLWRRPFFFLLVSSSEAVRLLSPQLPNRTADRFGGGLLLWCQHFA